MKSIYELPDEDAVVLIKEFNALPDYVQKIEFAAKLLPPERLLGWYKREIDGEYFIMSLKPTSDEEAQTFGDWFVPKYKEKVLNEKLQSLKTRIEKQQSDDLIIGLLDEERNQIIHEVHGKPDRKQGYTAEKLGTPLIYHFHPINWPEYKAIAEGAAYYHYEIEVKKLLKQFQQNPKSNIADGDEPISDNELPVFKKVAHKVLAFYELGIITHLRKEYPKLKEEEIACLITGLFGLEEENKETVRKAIGYIGLPSSNKKAIQTTTAIKKIKGELSKVGITELKRIKDLTDLD